MLSQGRSAAFRMDPETWQKLCAYSNQVHAPRDCPRFLEAIDLVRPHWQEVAKAPPTLLMSAHSQSMASEQSGPD